MQTKLFTHACAHCPLPPRATLRVLARPYAAPRRTQLALNDVPEEVRDLLGEMNGFADVLSKNHSQSERVNADVTRILDTLEGACRSFQGEIQSLPLVETD